MRMYNDNNNDNIKTNSTVCFMGGCALVENDSGNGITCNEWQIFIRIKRISIQLRSIHFFNNLPIGSGVCVCGVFALFIIIFIHAYQLGTFFEMQIAYTQHLFSERKKIGHLCRFVLKRDFRLRTVNDVNLPYCVDLQFKM